MIKSIRLNNMELISVVLLSFCFASFGPENGLAATFDVTSFGAKGDGNTDETKAFVRAWAALCGDKSANPTLIIPSEKTFLLGPISFAGPCESPKVHLKVLGNITAPKTVKAWKGCIKKEMWISFSEVRGLTIDGSGHFDGHGSLWWGKKVRTATCTRPWAIHFNRCDGLQLRGTTHLNSPRMHICVYQCQGVDIGNLTIVAPENSPNTDGINISGARHVHIHDLNIQTGDDCVAINGGSYDVNVTGVSCGPGHGISIGGLGDEKGHDIVEQVRVENCNITGTQNGVRIKTTPGGTGFARQILFQNIRLTDVHNPIIIDQHYCNGVRCIGQSSANAVQVSSVTYRSIYGSSATKKAITFDCSEKVHCNNILMDHVSITGTGNFAYCKNARGKFTMTSPRVICK